MELTFGGSLVSPTSRAHGVCEMSLPASIDGGCGQLGPARLSRSHPRDWARHRGRAVHAGPLRLHDRRSRASEPRCFPNRSPGRLRSPRPSRLSDGTSSTTRASHLSRSPRPSSSPRPPLSRSSSLVIRKRRVMLLLLTWAAVVSAFRYLLPPSKVGPEVVTMLTVFVAFASILSLMIRQSPEPRRLS